MVKQINYVRASYYLWFVLLSAVFTVAIYGALNHRPLIDINVLKAVAICGPMIALLIVRTDRDYLIKAIPLRALLVATACLGFAALYLERG